MVPIPLPAAPPPPPLPPSCSPAGGFSFSGAARYAILSPYANGNTTGNYRGRSQFSQMVAVDLSDFTVAGVSVVDLAATSRQQASMRERRKKNMMEDA